MALSKSILKKIQNDTETKKSGGSTASSPGGTQSSQGSASEVKLSKSIQNKIAVDLALKKVGFTHHRETGLLNDPRYKDYSTAVSTVDDAYIESFISDWNRYSKKAQTAVSGLNWKSATSGNNPLGDTSQDLMFRSAMVRSYLNANKDQLEEKFFHGFMSQLDDIDRYQREIDKAYASAKKFYSQWDTEEDYNTAQREYGYQKKYDGKSYEDIQSLLNDMEDGEEKNWLNSHKYEMVKSSADYDERSNSGWDKYLTEKEAQKKQQEDESWLEAIGRYLGAGTSDTTLPGANISQVTDNYRKDTSYREPTEQWTADMKNAFGYLYSRDPEEAWKYAEEVNNALASQEKAPQIQKIQEQATGGFWQGAGHTAGALLTAPLGLADYLDNLAEFNARGRITEKGGVTPFEYSQAVTSGISQNLNDKYGTLNENIPVIGGKGLGDVYGLGTSIAQSAMAAYSVGQVGTLVQFFGSAAAAGVDEAKQRGADDKNALMYGTMVGAAEAIAEQSGVDNLLKIGSSATMRELIGNIAKQGVAEGLEEGITSVLNNFADQLTMGDMTNFNILVRDYMSKGWSEEEAKKQAWIDMAEDIAFDMLGGFVSGAAHAGPQTAYQTIVQNIEYKSTYGDSAVELVQEGLEGAEDSLSHQLAVKYQEKLDNGKSLSGAEIHRLVQANEQQILAEDADSIRQAAANRLMDLGETDNVMELADILAKQATKQKLTKAEKQAVAFSMYGQRVANELNPQNINSGEYTSSWTGNIGTDRTNPSVYNRGTEMVQQPQNAANPVGEQVVAQAQKPAVTAQAEPVETTAANGQLRMQDFSVPQ